MAESEDPPTPADESGRPAAGAGLTAGVLTPASEVPRPLVVGAAVAGSALVGLTAAAGRGLLGGAVALAGVVLAWGWPRLLGSPSRVGSSAVLTVSTVLVVGAVLVGEPSLRLVPVAVAASVIAMFLHQLLRRDGRPRLTQSLAVTGGGVALIACGAGYVPLPGTPAGAGPVVAAAAAAAAAAPADLLVRWRAARPWLLPLAVTAGAAAALVVSVVGGLAGPPAVAVLLGALVAVVGHATRRVLAALPPIESGRGQLASASASLLVGGVVVYLLARLPLA